MIKRIKRTIAMIALGLGGLLVVSLLVSAISNLGLPTRSLVVERLGEQEKARLAEYFHLRQTLGEAVWPGWGAAEIPVIVYNEAFAFLVGYPNPKDGWVTVPQNEGRGGPWEMVPDDRFYGQVYYRQPLPATGETPQSFTVRVGDRWVASMQTKEWMGIALASQLRTDLPPALEPIFPYRLATRLLIGSSDLYVALMAHESFHAYQGMMAAERIAAAEMAVRQEGRYPWENTGLQDSWQQELDLLHAALQAELEAENIALVQRFLSQRRERRQEYGLEGDLAGYEQQREWLEGLAKYVELEIWRQAATSPGYQPVASLASVPDFRGYAGFEKRWSQELAQMRRMADDEGGGRFYYSGMAQAALLDRLMPGWKDIALTGGASLETLLETAVGQPGAQP